MNGNVTKNSLVTLNGTGSTTGLTHNWVFVSVSPGSCNSCGLTNTVGTPDYRATFTTNNAGGPNPVKYEFDLVITNTADGTYGTERVTFWALP